MKLRKVWLLASLMAGSLSVSAQSEYLKSYNVQRALEVINEDVQEAYKYVDQETDDTDRNPYAWMLLGKCFHIVEAEGKALTFTDRALDLLTSKKHKRIAEDPQWLAACYLQRAEIYDLLDHQDKRQSDLLAAMKLGKFAASTVELQVEQMDVMLAMAQYYYDQNEYDKADEVYRQATQVDAHDARPWIGLGRDAFARGLWQEAVDDYRMAPEVDPEYDPYHVYLIDPLMNLGQKEESAKEWWEALQSSTTSMQAIDWAMEDSVRVTMADELYAIMQSHSPLEEGQDLFKAAFELSCNWNEKAEATLNAMDIMEELEDLSLSAKVRVLSAQGRLEEAYDYASQLMTKDSADAGNCMTFARVLSDLGRFDEALMYSDRAIDLDPDNTSAYGIKSNCQQRQGDYEKCIETLQILLLLDPEDVSIHARLCEMNMYLNNEDEMRKEAEWVLAHDTVPGKQSCREKALLALGQYDEAIAWLDSVDAAYPFNSYETNLNRAEVMLRKGDLAEVRRYLEKAKELGYQRFAVLKQNYVYRDHQELFENL